MTRRPIDRRGFTLIELLVVITLIVTLAALAVLVAPRMSDSQKSAMGASKLQGWLGIAKQRAYRDKIISGVRLVPDPVDPNIVRTLAYIEQPLDFTGGRLSWTYPPPASPAPYVVTLDFNTDTSVQVNDFLAIFSPPDPQTHKIIGVTTSPTPAPNGSTQLTLLSPINVPPPLSGSTTVYRIIRQPRQPTGEPELQMPPDMAIYLNDGASTPTHYSQPALPLPPIAPSTTPRNIDILFQPTGEVLVGDQAGGYISRGKIILWVRDMTKPLPTDGEPSLITVFCRTGGVAAYPVNINPNFPTVGANDYYYFTKDGRTSGL